MDNHLSQIDERLRQLEDAIGRLAARVTALEEPRTERLAFGMPAVRPAMAAARPALPPGRELELPILTLVGRTFLVFGGAYLLRALTESGQLTPASGIVVGLTYASAWMGAADRAAVRRPASGLFHGLASLVIACPLLLEASTRFGVLSPASAAALLVLVTALALGVAWHRRLQSLAIMATVAGSITALVLAISTGQVWPFTFSALVIGVGAGIAGASRDWRWPSRAPVIVATLLTLDVAARALAETPIEPRGLSSLPLCCSPRSISSPWCPRSSRNMTSRRCWISCSRAARYWRDWAARSVSRARWARAPSPAWGGPSCCWAWLATSLRGRDERPGRTTRPLSSRRSRHCSS
jgi:hypothetical protein